MGLMRMAVGEALTIPGPGNSVLPFLARKWTLDQDRLTWRFQLQPNVHFQDGSILDAGRAVAALIKFRKQTAPARRSHFTNFRGFARLGLLGYAESAMNLIRADAVLAANNQPRSREPLLKGNWGIFKNGSGFERKRRTLVFRVALPYTLLGKIGNLLSAALRAFHNAIGPSQFNHELSAMFKFREPDCCVPKSVWRFHKPSMRLLPWNVKYVIALI